MVSFGVNNSKRNAVKEYKAQDEEFLKWAKEQLKEGRQIGYDCSW